MACSLVIQACTPPGRSRRLEPLPLRESRRRASAGGGGSCYNRGDLDGRAERAGSHLSVTPLSDNGLVRQPGLNSRPAAESMLRIVMRSPRCTASAGARERWRVARKARAAGGRGQRTLAALSQAHGGAGAERPELAMVGMTAGVTGVAD